MTHAGTRGALAFDRRPDTGRGGRRRAGHPLGRQGAAAGGDAAEQPAEGPLQLQPVDRARRRDAGDGQPGRHRHALGRGAGAGAGHARGRPRADPRARLRPDGRTLAATCDHDVTLWEASTGRPRATLRGPTDTVLGLAFVTDGRTLAAGDAACAVTLWDVATGGVQAVLRGHDFPVCFVTFAPDGQRWPRAMPGPRAS